MVKLSKSTFSFRKQLGRQEGWLMAPMQTVHMVKSSARRARSGDLCGSRSALKLKSSSKATVTTLRAGTRQSIGALRLRLRPPGDGSARLHYYIEVHALISGVLPIPSEHFPCLTEQSNSSVDFKSFIPKLRVAYWVTVPGLGIHISIVEGCH